MRQHELSELEQVAGELRKALERAKQRLSKKPVARILPEHFTDILKAIHFVETSLQTLCEAHPGDSEGGMLELIRERSEFTGWETWTSLLKELSEDEKRTPPFDHHILDDTRVKSS